MSGRGESFLLLALTALIGIVASVIPLPYWLAVLRPAFVVLVVLYWSTMAPQAGGIALGFCCGLILDVLSGAPLGEHALALALVSYLAIKLHLLVRAKPIFEQSLFVFAALMVYETMLWLIDGWSGHPLTTPLRWLRALTGGLLWPVVVGFLGRFHSPR